VSKNQLSVLGFGCMRFPSSLPGKTNMEKTEQMLVEAVSAGVNYFDTAYVYRNSEVELGDILTRNKLRDKVFIATKLPHGKCKDRADIERIFSESLQRLQTGHIDYYLVHNLPGVEMWQRLVEIGIKDWIAEKKAGGQIRQIGFSFHGSQPDFIELLDAYDWDFTQIQYNYMDENYQAGRAGLEAAAKRGLPVIVMEPLLGGKLATGLPAKAAARFRAVDSSKSLATWGFEWLYNQPEVTVVLSGMSSSEQLSDNLVSAGRARPGMLSSEEMAVFGPVVDAFKESYKVKCTGCNYCMPCPSKVNIPGCFAAYNSSYAVGFVNGVFQYVFSTGANHPGRYQGAENCTRCGVCEAKCPQQLPIRDSLAAVGKRMEPFWFGLLIKVVRRFS
jgi:predicted aldo/keto reductase-like oxidoreductase